MKLFIKKLLVILGIALTWSIIANITPDKYDVSVIGCLGWWSCLTWLWIFPHKKEVKS